MNQRLIGSILIIIAIILAAFMFIAKAREDAFIDRLIAQGGSCYLEDGTCLHEDRDYAVYISGWILSAFLFSLGMYLLLFDRTQQVLAQTQAQVSSALKDAKDKDEFKAYLAGFNEKEQSVLRAIHEQEGIKQATLRYKTGLSKTEMSLLLTDLEKRDIITRKQSGKSNEVYLRKRF